MTALATRHGVNGKTVAKWRKRQSVGDAPMGPKKPRSTSLTLEAAAAVVAFREHTLLPLGDCLGPGPVQYALQTSIPHLPRSSLHRCLRRHGISRLTDLKAGAIQKKAFKRYPIEYFHLNYTCLRQARGGSPDPLRASSTSG
jgi:hypothetical protein